MTNELNKFLAEFKSIVENGYTKNGRQFLGTSGSGILTVIDFNNATLGFDVRTKKPSREDLALAPLFAVYQVTPDIVNLIGGKKDAYVFNIEMFFTNQEKVVDAVKITEQELARYFLEEVNDAIDNCKSQFTTSPVASINRLPGVAQEGKMNNTNIYGFTARMQVVLG